MRGKVRYSPQSRSRRKQREIARQYGLMMTKKILPAAFLVMWLLAIAFVWWIALAPGRWKADTIIYARMDVVEVSLGRGAPEAYNVLVAADGRHFSLTEEERAALVSKLGYGEKFEIVYARNPIGLGPEHLKSLSTAEDGELISAEESLEQMGEDRKTMWWVIGGSVVLFVIVEVLIEVFGCRKERALIVRLRAEQAKFAAREQRQSVYKESKRAGV